jgi:hypothetical protein
MRASWAVLVVLGGCRGATPAPSIDPNQVSQLILDLDRGSNQEHLLERVEAFPIPGEEGMVVTIEDTWAHWFGTFCCYKIEDGKVAWEAGISDAPDEQSTLEMRGVRLQGFSSACVEVFGMSHMGNGYYDLYILEGRDLRCVLKTRAVDSHKDENLIRDGKLSVIYRDLNGDGIDDVVFAGIAEEYPDCDFDEKPLRSYPCRKVFFWNAGLRCYQEALSQRQGFESYSKFGD